MLTFRLPLRPEAPWDLFDGMFILRRGSGLRELSGNSDAEEDDGSAVGLDEVRGLENLVTFFLRALDAAVLVGRERSLREVILIMGLDFGFLDSRSRSRSRKEGNEWMDGIQIGGWDKNRTGNNNSNNNKQTDRQTDRH